MIIHLEVEWNDDILERFALIVAQQSIHFALQLNWILQGALEDYQPELEDGTPNETYNRIFYIRCVKLLKNVERCVVYGKPRAAALQRLYEQGKITKKELQIMEHADRRFVALHLTSLGSDEENAELDIDGWLYVQYPTTFTRAPNSPMHLTALDSNISGEFETKPKSTGSHQHTSEFTQRWCVLDRHVLNVYVQTGTCAGGELKLDRAMYLQRANVSSKSNEIDSFIITIETPRYEFKLRCSSKEEHRLWLRRLQEESYQSLLFQKKDAKLREDLSPAQLDRYNFFDHERQFIYSLTDLAEALRDKDRTERKQLAPELMKRLHIPDTVYLPLCNSSDTWRRISIALSKDTRVFNTKARCPVIMNFVSRRGETHKHCRIDPNLDVAEYMHMYFEVAPEMEGVAEDEGEGEEVKEEFGKNGELMGPEHESASGAWQKEDDDDPQTPKDSEAKAAGNRRVQQLLRESVVMLPNKLANRLPQRNNMRRGVSVMDRQTKMQQKVPIVEGSNKGNVVSTFGGNDPENASVDDGSVVSVGRSSVRFRDRVILGDLDEGDIDVDCINRAKKYVSGGESWAEKTARMLQEAQNENGNLGEASVTLEIASCMSKSNDDLRQEVFVMQMIHYYKSVFAMAKLPLWLKTYRILSCSSSTGLIEVLTDATSLDGLKKAEGYPYETGGLRKYYEMVYGKPDSAAFKAAQKNFMHSLAGYALVSYLLGLKDRHNGNIMIDTRGHLVFIDFGFAMGMAPGHEFSMERAPFKLTNEYVDVMGGVNSDCYKEFERLFVDGFVECRKNSQVALGLVEIMMYKSNYPCFSGRRYGHGKALVGFEKRLMLHVPDSQVKHRALKLVRRSRGHFGTYLYDLFQKKSNGYAM